MQQLEFVFTYGQPQEQKKKTAIDDPNRQYMIKYKYDTITNEELNKFHDQLQKLIYDTIRKNFVQVEIKDVYQEIWKKISKAKHSWNENMGTKVSTWIVLVCLSVINGLRAKAKKHQDRYVLYNDLCPNDENNENNEKGQTIAIKFGLVDDKEQRQIAYKEDLKYFLDSLNEKEKSIVDLILNVDVDELNKNGNIKYKRKRITKTFIRSKMNMKLKDFQKVMNGLQKKYKTMIMYREYNENASEDY